MAEMKHNALLEKLLEHAKTVGDKPNAPLSVERFLVALLDAMDGTFRLEPNESVSSAEKLIRVAGIDPVKSKETLLAHIRNSKGLPVLDELNMKKRMDEAADKAKKEKQDEVTPEHLLLCILVSPTLAIRECLPADDAKQDFDCVAGLDADDIDTILDSADEEDPVDAKQKITELTERVKSIHATLSDMVLGQDNAVSVFTSGYFQAELLSLTDKKRVRPCATYLFAGPPGVGKTFLAESAAKVLDLPFQRYDMSEYCDNEAAIEFCGSDKVYKNGKSGNFTTFVSQHPKSVILFDEIEKAHISIIHLFLQILDAGRIRDNFTDEEISLKDVIMIFTTNAGKQLYEDSDTGDFSTVSRKVILKALQKDVNPTTGNPYFPAAICSRFASGNVVMFNHIAAHDLRDIARREVLRHAGNFEREVGVKVTIDDKVFTALLFAEGGAADARTVRSRAETFFDNELFELFRLTSSNAADSGIGDIESIKITVELPANDPELLSLFESNDKPEMLVFSSEEVAALCASKNTDCEFVPVSDIAGAAECLGKRDIQAVLLDVNYGRKKDGKKYLNIEDMESTARDFFWYVRERYGDLPIYLLQTTQHTFEAEELVSFLRQGARGVLAISGETDSFAKEINKICSHIHQQKSMSDLAKANKLVTFETSQRLTRMGKNAEIRLFDFELVVALDPEDSQNILSSVSKPNVKFEQVIGADDVKKELRYFVEYLKNPKKYLGTGVRAPKGVLLYGPPGTGKTMLAKAMASESDVTFITAEGNQFLKQYVGEGAQKVHELFRTARKYAPSILFVDEIDAIAKERTGDNNKGAEEVLTAFLTEMDGFKNDTSKPVFVLAATNFDVEPGHSKSLDPALMRRFDRRVYIDLPNRDDRILYMQQKIAGNPAFQITDSKVENIAVRSTGMSLAELESVFELSLRTVLREGNFKVTDAVLEEAFETFNSGEKKNWDISQLQRVARHEAGHAFLCWKGGETPSYVTVVARANHGGYMQHGDNEGKAIYTKDELLARIRTSLGGRAAEIAYYGPEDGISTGASGDLSSATNLAQQIICSYGMDADFGLAVIDPQSARMGEISSAVRLAVNKILSEELKNAIDLIKANQTVIDRLVDTLLSKNHLSGSEIQTIFEGNSPEKSNR